MPDSLPACYEEIDPAVFRSVLGHFCSGVTVITAMHEGRPVGLTCQSFFSLSMKPALVAFSVGRTSTSYPRISSAGSLVINILASGQEEISNAFARTGTDKWAGISWCESDVVGHPVIDGVVAHLECDICCEVEGGDHLLVVARVRHLQSRLRPVAQVSPLLFYRGEYFGLSAKVHTSRGQS
jgi:3-hydroxy-9,10-secoandrosta-1,3,5(10)-triene-9,17-dione monooxygenase reductase component